MTPVRPLISAIKSALIRVPDLASARPFYQGVLGLHVLQETDFLSDKMRRLWGLPDRQLRCLRLGKPGENFGMLDLIECTGQTAEPIRQPERPWDYGWFTLNLKTSHLDRALTEVNRLGIAIVTPPHEYEAGGQAIRKAMIKLPTGERCTLLQFGPGNERAPLFGEPLATMGVVVPSLAEALAFYRDALGLAVTVTTDHTGAPFATLLGLPPETRVQTAVLTSNSHWTGKYELLELTLPPGAPAPEDTNIRADGQRLGFWMMSVMTPDLDALQAAFRYAGVSVLRGPATVDRPCFGRVKALIVRAPGGELLECMAPATGPVSSRM